MKKPRVLFLCTGNACRSQMAEGWLRHLAGERFECLSAGTSPHGLDRRAVRAMREAGVDISAQRSKHIHEYLAEPPDLVITVCDSAARSCPTFPGAIRVVHWPFPDPAGATGTDEEVGAVFAEARDAIRAKIAGWLAAGAALDGTAA